MDKKTESMKEARNNNKGTLIGGKLGMLYKLTKAISNNCKWNNGANVCIHKEDEPHTCIIDDIKQGCIILETWAETEKGGEK